MSPRLPAGWSVVEPATPTLPKGWEVVTPSAPSPVPMTRNEALRREAARQQAAAPRPRKGRLEAAGEAVREAETAFRAPATGFMSEVNRVAAALGLGPRVIEAAVTRGEGFRKVLADLGIPDEGSFGPAAALAFLASAAADPATYLTAGLARVTRTTAAAKLPALRPGPARAAATAAREAPAPRQTMVPEIQMRAAPAATEPANVYAQRVSFAPGIEGEVLLPRRAGPVPNVPSIVPGELAQDVLQESVHRRITTAAEDLFTRAGIQRDPRVRISDQISMLLADARIPLPELDAMLRRYNLSLLEFANETFRPSIKDAARRMQALSALQRRLNAVFQQSPQDADRLRDLAGEVDQLLAARSLWTAPVRIWRGLLVSQPATAARNFVTQVARIGLDVLDQGVQAGLQKVTGKPVTASPLEPMRAMFNIFFRPRAVRGEVETLLMQVPREWDRMFGTFASDVATRARKGGYALTGKDRVLQGAEDGVSLLNTANRFQEFVTRRAVFEAHLWQRLRVQGKDLLDVIARNAIDAVTEGEIKAAVEKSLEVTFARQMQRGTFAYHFVRAINRLGVLAAPVVPFPRFMMEALRFYFEFSPFGLLKMLAPAERAAIAAGNMQTLSRAVVGAGMLGTAYAFRSSEHAGERWYEAKGPDGRNIDLRPFNPFSPYLFAGEVIRRYQDGTLYRLDARDLVQAFAGVSTRAGTGLYLLDQLLDQFSDESKAQRALVKMQRVAGEFVSGYLTPLQTVSDVMAEFDESLRVVREEGEDPFLGPIKARIPPLRTQLPEVESPTRAGPLMREAPLLRQTTGITLSQAKNPLERELDRLQFNRQEVMPSTGDARADRLIAKHMGPLAEQFLVRIVQQPGFERLSDAGKGEFLRRALMQIRDLARSRAEAEDPQLFAAIKAQRRPIRERRLLEEMGGQE